MTQNYIQTLSISSTAANDLISAALAAAKLFSLEISIAVVDNAGLLKAFIRSDDAPFLTIDASINKAWTAASFGYPTHVWNNFLSNPQLAPLGNTPRMLAVGGGHPLLVDGKVIGGIGISGGTYVQDQEIAEAALDAAGFDYSKQ